MTRAQMLYIILVLAAVALALVPLTLIIASKRPARSEPIIYVVPSQHLPDRIWKPRRQSGTRLAYWRVVVPGLSGLPMVV